MCRIFIELAGVLTCDGPNLKNPQKDYWYLRMNKRILRAIVGVNVLEIQNMVSTVEFTVMS